MSAVRPKVSVLIPAYNRAKFVGEAIQSVLDQSFDDFEVIVVDDGSVDATAEVVRRITDPRIRLIQQQNGGICSALNRAFRESRGQYVSVQNSDDRWMSDLLATEVPILDCSPRVALVYARAQAMDSAGRPLAQSLGAPQPFPRDAVRSIAYGDFVCAITVLVRRDLLEQAGLWDETLVANEDWDLHIRLAFLGEFRFVDRVLAHFRIHEDNITGVNSGKFGRLTHDRIRVIEKLYARSDLPQSVLAIRGVAFRNVYLDAALRWQAVGAYREAVSFVALAWRHDPRKILFPFRLVYLFVFHRVLSKRTWTSRLVQQLVNTRRRVRALLSSPPT